VTVRAKPFFSFIAPDISIFAVHGFLPFYLHLYYTIRGKSQ
jgi:hypothetical protein